MPVNYLEKELEKVSDKKLYLKNKLDQETDSSLKTELRKEYVNEIKKDSLVKLENFEPADFRLGYDSIGEGLEPIYFWVLDFMRSDEPSGLGLEVAKVEENFEATTASAYFGEMGTRRSVMEDRAMKMLQMVNTIVRSIINLIYDLKDFKQRLSYYDDFHSSDSQKKESGELALKGIWLDQVDLQKGRASINVLTQQLQFYTLRDAFFAAKSTSDIKNMDLNDRVKRILIRKIEEYLKWRSFSEEELRKRNSIELQYLKSQVDSLKLYTKWARPYLRAAQQLKMKEFNSPDLVQGFDNMMMELRLFGKKELKPESVFADYGRIKFGRKFYSCVEVEFRFRTIPQALRTQQGNQFVNSGVTEMTFRPYVFTDEEIEAIEAQELYEDMDIVEQLTNVSLQALRNDLDEFLNPKKEEKQEKKLMPLPKIPILGAVKGFIDMIKSINKGLFTLLNVKSGTKHNYETNQIRQRAQETALKNAFLIYDLYKKTHGMLSW